MNRCVLGSTGLLVSKVGLGTWPVSGNDGLAGYGPRDEEQAEATVRAACEAGVLLFDTADVYGGGYAERLLGRELAKRAPEAIIATKGGFDLAQGKFNPQAEFLRSRVSASLERLERDHLDIYLLHNPPAHLLCLEAPWRPLLELRERGKIRHLGVSVEHVHDVWLALEHPWVEVLQLPYNLVHDEADRGVLQEASARGVGILVREALANGLLSGQSLTAARFSQFDFRSQLPDSVFHWVADGLARWQPYRRNGESWVDFALRFALDRPEVSAVLVGARKVEHVRAVEQAGRLPPRVKHVPVPVRT